MIENDMSKMNKIKCLKLLVSINYKYKQTKIYFEHRN